MKAERRHELKENDLVHALHVARDYIDEHGRRIGFALMLVVAAVVAVAFTVRSRAAAVADVWRRKAELSFADPDVGKQSIDALGAMTDGITDERFVFDSLVEQGFQALRLARDVPFPPDPDLTGKARRAFEQLRERFPENPLAVGLARSALVTVEENEFMLDGDPVHRARAEEHLTSIIEDPLLNGFPFQRMAIEQRETLDAVFAQVTFEYPEPPEEEAEPSPAEAIEIVDPVVGPTDSADDGDSTGSDAPVDQSPELEDGADPVAPPAEASEDQPAPPAEEATPPTPDAPEPEPGRTR